jgi:short-subunit dehydrogenase
VTETGFFDAANIDRPPGRVVQSAEDVVETALRGLKRGKGHIISGWTNLMMIESERLVPRSFVTRMAGKVLRKEQG